MMQIYAQRHMLPTRRLQLQLALIAQATARDPKATLQDFLFDYVPPPAPGEEVEAAGNALADMAGGGNVVVLGRKKKDKVN